MVLWRWFLIVTLFGGTWNSKPLAAAGYSFNQMPADLDQVDVYLHTIDIGNLIFNNFGHSALRVHDKVSGRDLVFNWGIFDFRSPISFGLEFYRGILIYQLGIYPNRWVQERYQEEKRKVWEDKLYLSREQKKKLFERLIWNSEPANRGYAYQYFFDNCSTRIRDYLDEAVGGGVRQATHFNHAPETFRDMVYDGYSYNPGMDLFLDIAMNGNIDRLMTLWERMFHPIYMRDVFLQQQIDGHPLVEESRVLWEFPRPESYPGLSFILILLLFGVPFSLIGVAFFFRAQLGFFLPVIYRLFAFVGLPLAMFGGLIGFLMPLTWMVSAHIDLHHNANMLLFWPLDGILVIWMLAILVQGRSWALDDRKSLFLRRYVLLHLIGTLVMPVLRLLGLISQNVDRVIVWVLPPYMVLLFLLWRVGLAVRETKAA